MTVKHPKIIGLNFFSILKKMKDSYTLGDVDHPALFWITRYLYGVNKMGTIDLQEGTLSPRECRDSDWEAVRKPTQVTPNTT